MEHFSVKHYLGGDRPSIKGNGFDGLEIGVDRDETQEFVDFVNRLVDENTRLRANADRKFLVAVMAAHIEWRYGAGSEAAMQRIENAIGDFCPSQGDARSEAMEEAARICERYAHSDRTPTEMAEAIRAAIGRAK